LIAAFAEDIHRFWFAGCETDPVAATARGDVWFRSSSDLDLQIRERFGSTIQEAARGELSSWQETPRSCVSLVVVLDQFPRNAFRNTAAAFDNDPAALAIVRRAIAACHPDKLTIVERAFLLMPYQHVEDLESQREGMQHFEHLAATAPAQWRAFAENTLQFARSHLEIIERFGRFPHRNRMLRRSSTLAEREYLDSKPDTFGQGQ